MLGSILRQSPTAAKPAPRVTAVLVGTRREAAMTL